jgi:hypothetical protein
MQETKVFRDACLSDGEFEAALVMLEQKGRRVISVESSDESEVALSSATARKDRPLFLVKVDGPLAATPSSIFVAPSLIYSDLKLVIDRLTDHQEYKLAWDALCDRTDVDSQYRRTLIGFFVGKKEETLRLCSGLLLDRRAQELYSVILMNLHFYYSRVPACRYRQLPEILPKPHWHSMNPALVRHEGKLQLLVRRVNSGKDGDWSKLNDGTPVSEQNPIISKNFRATVNEDGVVSDWRPLLCQHNLLEVPGSRVQGLEDIRLFEFRGSVWFMCSSIGYSPSRNPVMVLGRESPYNYAVRLQGPKGDICEKNWLPFEHKGKLMVVYGYSPFTILEVDPDTGATHTCLTREYAENLGPFRGSAPPVALVDGHYLAVIHEVLYPRASEGRRYTHRFLLIGPDLDLLAVSVPFVMRGEHAIEYVAGAAIVGEKLFLTWGGGDKTANLTVMSLQTALGMCDIPVSPK